MIDIWLLVYNYNQIKKCQIYIMQFLNVSGDSWTSEKWGEKTETRNGSSICRGGRKNVEKATRSLGQVVIKDL